MFIQRSKAEIHTQKKEKDRQVLHISTIMIDWTQFFFDPVVCVKAAKMPVEIN